MVYFWFNPFESGLHFDKQDAIEFAQRANQLSSATEIALFGSLAKGDPYQKDIDLAVIISSLEQLPTLAKYARKMSSLFNSWDIFVFNADIKYLGRICHRKECPSKVAECINCGDIAFVHHRLKDLNLTTKISMLLPFKHYSNDSLKACLLPGEKN